MAGLGILVGPGVVRAGAVAGLHAFADAAACGVVNTWGAKGVFVWDDARHFGTAGLQAHDFELAGLGDVDVLVTSGLDPAEVTSAPWAGRAEVIDIEPSALELAAGRIELPPGTLERPRLYTELAAVCGPLYGRPSSAPARAAALAAELPEGGLVVAEPGLVGFWVARTFPTAVPGSVVVPASGGREASWSLAGDVASTGRPVTLVVDSRSRVRDLPAGVRVERWGDDVDLDPAPLVAVAGEIVAWR